MCYKIWGAFSNVQINRIPSNNSRVMISLSHLMLIMFIEVETLISNSNYTRGIIGEGGSSTLYQSLEDFKHAQNSPAFVPLDINGMT